MAKAKSFNIESLARYKRCAVNTMVLVVAVAVVGVAMVGGGSFWNHVAKVPVSVLVVLGLASLVENVLRNYR